MHARTHARTYVRKYAYAHTRTHTSTVALYVHTPITARPTTLSVSSRVRQLHSAASLITALTGAAPWGGYEIGEADRRRSGGKQRSFLGDTRGNVERRPRLQPQSPRRLRRRRVHRYVRANARNDILSLDGSRTHARTAPPPPLCHRARYRLLAEQKNS